MSNINHEALLTIIPIIKAARAEDNEALMTLLPSTPEECYAVIGSMCGLLDALAQKYQINLDLEATRIVVNILRSSQ